MPKKINDQEIAAVTALPASARYSHFIEQVADWEVVWSLRGQDGWVQAAADSGQSLMPVWPHAPYAMACANGDWSGTAPEAIPLDRWLTDWIPGLTRDGRGLAVFPVPASVGVHVSADRLMADLSAALEQYGGGGK